MAGEKWGNKTQYGVEATPGTEVSAISLFRGEFGSFKDDTEVTLVAENVGYTVPTDRSYVAKKGGTWNMDSTPATFEQLPVLFAAGLKDTVAGQQGGSGTGYEYIYTINATSANTIKTFTLRNGDNQQAERMQYSFVESIELSGAPGEAVMMGATWKGREVINDAFSSGISVPTVEEILSAKGALYINAASNTFGSSRVTQTLYDWSVTINTGRTAKHLVDSGSVVFSYVYLNKDAIDIEAALTYEHNTNARTEKTAWRNETPRNIRLEFSGSGLATSGLQLGDNKRFRMDLTGKYTDFEAIESQDGNNTVACTFKCGYNEDADHFFSASIVNEIARID